MKSGNEQYAIAFLDLVLVLSLKLPIRVIDEYENARSSD